MRVISIGEQEEKQVECPKCKGILGYYDYDVNNIIRYPTAIDSPWVPNGMLGYSIEKNIYCPICGNKIELGFELY